MNIEEINKRHLFKTDQLYRIGFGLSSRLLDFKNGIIYLEVLFGRKWNESYNQTAYELAYCWRENNQELKKAIGCKVFIIDGKKNTFKRDLYLKRITPSYDAMKGLLFSSNILN